MRKAIGIDIGGTNFRIGCFTEAGDLLASEKYSSSLLCGSIPAKNAFSEQIKKFMQSHNISTIDAIAAGFPSPVSKDGVVYSCPNLKNEVESFDGINIKEYLESEFNVPAFVVKDAVFLLQAEIQERKVNKDSIVVGMYFGTGIGNCVYYGGEYISGANGSGCDVGHIPVLKSENMCNCGNVGCIEAHASGAYLVKLWKEKYSDIKIDDIFEKYGEEKDLIEFVEACAMPIATEINIFDPNIVIIGGGVVDMKAFPYELMIKKTYEWMRKPIPAQTVVLEKAKVIKDAGIIGAASYAFERI